MSTKKQGQRIFSITSFKTDEILYNLEDFFLSLLRTQLQLHFQQTPYLRRFILMMSGRIETETINRMEEA